MYSDPTLWVQNMDLDLDSVLVNLTHLPPVGKIQSLETLYVEITWDKIAFFVSLPLFFSISPFNDVTLYFLPFSTLLLLPSLYLSTCPLSSTLSPSSLSTCFFLSRFLSLPSITLSLSVHCFMRTGTLLARLKMFFAVWHKNVFVLNRRKNHSSKVWSSTLLVGSIFFCGPDCKKIFRSGKDCA
ncbi:hypothetical protein AMTRI_Chr12g269320 [Amborella trichopoda]